MRLPQLTAPLLAAQLLAPAAFAAPGALLEIWSGLPGNGVAELTASPKYIGPPDGVRILPQLSFDGLGDSYGTRTSTLLSPPRTGEFTFWLASDDGGELWLSADASPARLKRIAVVSGWTAPQQWDATPEQKSAPVRLEAGRRYLLRVLQKQGGGGNHAGVAWSGPGLERQVIGGKALLLPPVGKALQARIAATLRALTVQAELRRKAEAYMTRGETIPVKDAAGYTVSSEGPPPNDRGINVLIDQGHQTQFVVLWGLRDQMRGQGFRACTSLAALDSVLTPGRPCRVRLSVDELEPFAWWPAAEFNVVVLFQQDLNAQAYTAEEQAALRAFVEGGGGLLVCGTRPPDPAAADGWSLNRFLDTLDCRYTSVQERAPSGPAAVLRLGDGWEALARGAGGQPVRARRTLGRGRIIVAEGAHPFNPAGTDPPDVRDVKLVTLRETLTWLAGGRPAAGGDGKLPHIGGVGIFPEREQNLGGVVVYYAANQKPDVLQCIQENIPRAARQVQAWLPTRMHAEPYTIVICGGTGGGWAIQP
ncbi:MAG: hypothetical protein HYU66_22810, partial [Armatimonadetes bacterium]|nr:hypothetical protein [Armatimonadota bacterium]